MEKILNIYKPRGLTSFDVVACVRKKLNIKKVGHAGTLDPLAEGVLVVLVGDSTKKQDSFMKQDKEYYAEIALGFSTNSYDLEGSIEDENFVVELDSNHVQTVLQSFVGTYMQKVPAFSAIKVDGKRLYKDARKGKIEKEKLPVREVKVNYVKLDAIKNEYIEKVSQTLPVICVTIGCGSGFYVRSFAVELGEKLGYPATLTKLIRTKVGEFSVTNAISLDSL